MNKDEMIKEMAENQKGEGCLLCNGNQCDRCRLIVETICRAGYRKIADDEIVIKNSEYAALREAKYENMYKYVLDRAEEHKKQLEQAKQDTAREILQELYKKVGNLESCLDPDYEPYYKAYKSWQVWDIIKQLAKKHGIEFDGQGE